MLQAGIVIVIAPLCTQVGVIVDIPWWKWPYVGIVVVTVVRLGCRYGVVVVVFDVAQQLAGYMSSIQGAG